MRSSFSVSRKLRARFREDVRKVGERCDAAFERRLVADVEDHAGSDGSRGILPIALLRAVLAGTHDHVGDVLGIAHVPRSEEANFGERIEPGTAGLFNRRKLEAQVSLLRAEAGRLGPVLTLDVIDHGRFRPGQQGRNDQADAFAGTRGRERENMLGAVVPQIVKVLAAIPAPCADISALPARGEPGIPDVVFIGPTRGAVQVLGILHQLAGAAIRHHEEDGDASEASRPRPSFRR